MEVTPAPVAFWSPGEGGACASRHSPAGLPLTCVRRSRQRPAEQQAPPRHGAHGGCSPASSPSALLRCLHTATLEEKGLSKPLIGRYLSPSFPSSAYLPFAFTLKRRHRGCLCPWEAVCGWCRSSAHSFSSPPRSPKPGPFGDLTLQPLPSPEQVELDGRERRWGWRGD